jgi:hypothetical protein
MRTYAAQGRSCHKDEAWQRKERRRVACPRANVFSSQCPFIGCGALGRNHIELSASLTFPLAVSTRWIWPSDTAKAAQSRSAKGGVRRTLYSVPNPTDQIPVWPAHDQCCSLGMLSAHQLWKTASARESEVDRLKAIFSFEAKSRR